jgi:universal stress protein E
VLSGASAWAKALDRELHVVYGLSVSPVLKDLDLIDIDKHTAEQKAKLKPIVDDYIRRYNLNPEHVHLKSKPPHKAIPSVASRINADLLMVGTVGRKGAKAKLMGNTSERILQHLRTDLMAFKP